MYAFTQYQIHIGRREQLNLMFPFDRTRVRIVLACSSIEFDVSNSYSVAFHFGK